jgi:hypothetical protein
MLNADPPPVVVVVHLTIVEMTSALTRRMREGLLDPEEYAQVQNAFRIDCLHEYEMVTAVGDIIDETPRLLELYPLRAYDAVHPATAVVVNRQLRAGRLASLIFVCADEQLNNTALAEGLTASNPNDYLRGMPPTA